MLSPKLKKISEELQKSRGKMRSGCKPPTIAPQQKKWKPMSQTEQWDIKKSLISDTLKLTINVPCINQISVLSEIYKGRMLGPKKMSEN